ncbi:MAG TPA: hypothetical protein VLT88_06505 [Desulfosarcina sp.]|nr:hypothetical protein [Desulfosarcina sp.]
MNPLKRNRPSANVTTQRLACLPLLIAAAVFSTSRLLFWDKQVADWTGYMAVHLLVIATIWSMLKVVLDLPAYRQDAETKAEGRETRHVVRLLTMLALFLVTAIVACIELFSDVHPMFK